MDDTLAAASGGRRRRVRGEVFLFVVAELNFAGDGWYCSRGAAPGRRLVRREVFFGRKTSRARRRLRRLRRRPAADGEGG